MTVEGVKAVKADAKQKSARITYDPGKVTPERLVEAVNTKTNFKASLQ